MRLITHSDKKAQMNTTLLGIIVFVALVLLLLWYIMARQGDASGLVDALPKGP